MYRKVAYGFIAITLIVIFSVLWLSSVRADVVVRVKKEPVHVETSVTVAKQASTGQLPGRVLTASYTKTQEFATRDLLSTSTAMVVTPTPAPSSTVPVRAGGTVRIINKYSKSQTLVEKTRLLTADGKLYRLRRRVSVPPGGEATVEVYADQLGSSFAIGPTKFTIPGLWPDLQSLIFAQSDMAFSAVPVSGADAVVTATPLTSTSSGTGPIVTAEMIMSAQEGVRKTILEQAKKDLLAEANDPKWNDAVYVTRDIEKPRASLVPGQRGERLAISLSVEVTAVLYAKEDMQVLVRSRLKERVPEGREFLPVQDHLLNYTLASASSKTEVAEVRVQADGQYRLTAGSPTLQRALITGRGIEEAKTILKSMDGVEEVEITLHPGWMGKLPSLIDHIDLKVE
jgi:hypothetical protein